MHSAQLVCVCTCKCTFIIVLWVPHVYVLVKVRGQLQELAAVHLIFEMVGLSLLVRLG